MFCSRNGGVTANAALDALATRQTLLSIARLRNAVSIDPLLNLGGLLA